MRLRRDDVVNPHLERLVEERGQRTEQAQHLVATAVRARDRAATREVVQDAVGQQRADRCRVASLERERVAFHGDAGYVFGGLSSELAYGGAVTGVATPRLTLVGEIVGRRLSSAGRLTEATEAHPTLVGVETIRLTSVERATNRVSALIGFKWNVAATLLVSANVVRPLTSAGLTTRWMSTFSLDYSFEP